MIWDSFENVDQIDTWNEEYLFLYSFILLMYVYAYLLKIFRFYEFS